MIFPIAAGHTDYSSTGTTRFIPQIWSSKLVVKFYAATVFGEIANTDYEGEIKDYGDKVIIRSIPDMTITDYSKNADLNYESPTSTPVELNIDKGKYFAFAVESVDKKQADIPYLDKWSNDASMQMKISIDTQILGDVYADAHASNIGLTAGVKSSSYNMGTTGTPVPVTKTNVLDFMVDCGSVLSEQNVPETDRWIVLPIWMCNLIKKSDLKDASLTGDETSVLRNGRIGRIDDLTIYKSNNLTSVTDGSDTTYNVMCGHKSAITFASQMVKMETLMNPKTFGELVRGLNVYGYKVVKPESLAVLYCKKG